MTPQTPRCSQDSASGEPAPEAGAPEVEITPEMIEAGLDAYYSRDPRVEFDSEIVTRIFERMSALKKR